jgi:hypothetical protein
LIAQGYGDVAAGQGSVEGKVAGGQHHIDGHAGSGGDGGDQRLDGEAGAALNHGKRSSGGGSGGVITRIAGVGLAERVAAGREDAGGPLGNASRVKRLRRCDGRRTQLVSEGDGSGGRSGLSSDGGIAALWQRIQEDLRSVGQSNAG